MSNPTSEAAMQAAEKLYAAGCGHVMEVKEMAAIIEAEFTTGDSADGQVERIKLAVKRCIEASVGTPRERVVWEAVEQAIDRAALAPIVASEKCVLCGHLGFVNARGYCEQLGEFSCPDVPGSELRFRCGCKCVFPTADKEPTND